MKHSPLLGSILPAIAVASACGSGSSLHHRGFVRIMLEPDKGGGGGGGTEPKTLSDALASLGAVRTELATAQKDLATAQAEASTANLARQTAEANSARLQADFDALKLTAGEHKTALATAEANVLRLTGELAVATKSVASSAARISNLESLCDIRGVDAASAVSTAKPATERLTSAEWGARLKAESDPVKRQELVKAFEAAVKAGEVAK